MTNPVPSKPWPNLFRHEFFVGGFQFVSSSIQGGSTSGTLDTYGQYQDRDVVFRATTELPLGLGPPSWFFRVTVDSTDGEVAILPARGSSHSPFVDQVGDQPTAASVPGWLFRNGVTVQHGSLPQDALGFGRATLFYGAPADYRLRVGRPEGAACDDANACTEGTTCHSGICADGLAVACYDDGDPCTVERCDVAQGCVRSVPVCNEALACRLGIAVPSGCPGGRHWRRRVERTRSAMSKALDDVTLARQACRMKRVARKLQRVARYFERLGRLAGGSRESACVAAARDAAAGGRTQALAMAAAPERTCLPTGACTP